MRDNREERTATAAREPNREPRPRDEYDERADEFRSRWTTIQGDFVDEPRRAVQEADELVVEAMKRLGDAFAAERSRLEERWARQNEVSTEDLRVAFQGYRSFFDRLLGMQDFARDGHTPCADRREPERRSDRVPEERRALARGQDGVPESEERRREADRLLPR